VKTRTLLWIALLVVLVLAGFVVAFYVFPDTHPLFKSPTFAGLFVLGAAVIGASTAMHQSNTNRENVKRQIQADKENRENQIRADKLTAATQIWWDRFEWVAERSVGDRAEGFPTDIRYALTLSLLNSAKKSGDDMQAKACGALFDSISAVEETAAQDDPSRAQALRTPEAQGFMQQFVQSSKGTVVDSDSTAKRLRGFEYEREVMTQLQQIGTDLGVEVMSQPIRYIAGERCYLDAMLVDAQDRRVVVETKFTTNGGTTGHPARLDSEHRIAPVNSLLNAIRKERKEEQITLLVVTNDPEPSSFAQLVAPVGGRTVTYRGADDVGALRQAVVEALQELGNRDIGR